MITITKSEYRKRLIISWSIGLLVGLGLIFIVYLFFIPTVSFSKKNSELSITSILPISKAFAQENENEREGEVGKMVSWSREAEPWVREIKNKIKMRNGNIFRGDNKLLKWDRSAIGWVVDANLLRNLVNHQIGTTDVVDYLALELGDKQKDLEPFTLVLTGFSKRKFKGTEKVEVNNPDLYGGNNEIYRVINLYPDSIPDNQAKASIEYVGPCNTCP